MESAVFLSHLVQGIPSGYDRIYFGSEFCPWTFPGLESVLEAIAAAHLLGMKFTLATPVLAEAVVERLRRILEAALPLLKEGDEVLISDLGALELVRQIDPKREVILGRTLSGQKRGPRILDLDLTDEEKSYFRRGSWYSGEAVRLLGEMGVRRVELDNLLQGIDPLPASLSGSLHYPFIMVTSSRNCPFRQGPGDRGCPARCGEVFVLRTPQTSVALLQGGNTQFLENHRLPSDFARLGVNRLVHHVFLPK